MPSINTLFVARIRVLVRAGYSRPLLPLEFVRLSIRGEKQREIEIAVERSGSRCARVSKLIPNWPTERRSTKQTEAEISVESQSLTPAKPSREVRASDLPAVEQLPAAI